MLSTVIPEKLRLFNEEELKERYPDIAFGELAESLERHPILYKINLANHFVANYGLCGCYMTFTMMTISGGLSTTINLFFPKVTIPSAIDQSFSITTSVI